MHFIMSFSVCSIDKGAFLHMVMEVCFSLPIYKTPNLDAFGFGFFKEKLQEEQGNEKSFWLYSLDDQRAERQLLTGVFFS